MVVKESAGIEGKLKGYITILLKLFNSLVFFFSEWIRFCVPTVVPVVQERPATRCTLGQKDRRIDTPETKEKSITIFSTILCAGYTIRRTCWNIMCLDSEC